MNKLSGVLWAETADEAAQSLEDLDEDVLGAATFGACLVPALQGQWNAVELLVGAWHGGVVDALRGFSPKVPDVVVDGNAVFVKSLSGARLASGVEILGALVTEIPTSPLLTRYGLGTGASVTLLNAVRAALPHGPGAFVLPAGYPDLPPGTDLARFRRLCDAASRRMRPPLTYIAEQFGLSRSELGALFGVSRQAVDEWETRGRVPERHAEKVADLVALSELLDRKLKPGRLQLIVRRPSPAFGGRTFMDMVREGKLHEVREQTEAALDWAATA
jgi:hypothetical protein